jgi:hypothetical protein
LAGAVGTPPGVLGAVVGWLKPWRLLNMGSLPGMAAAGFQLRLPSGLVTSIFRSSRNGGSFV